MTVRPFFYIPMPHWLLESPRVWALEASLRGSYTRFIDFSGLHTTILVVARAQDRPPAPRPPPRALDFHSFLFTFREGNIGGSKGGIMTLEGVKISKKLKLRADLFHHTHEVWGPCSYENTPLRGRALRVLDSYCGFPIFAQAVLWRFVCVLLTQGVWRHFQSVWC